MPKFLVYLDAFVFQYLFVYLSLPKAFCVPDPHNVTAFLKSKLGTAVATAHFNT